MLSRKVAKLIVSSTIEQPNKDGIAQDNIGNKMLKMMGWKEGQGLGASGDGITQPVQAEAYTAGVGLGAGQTFTAEELASSSKKDMIKKKTKIRFNLSKK